MSILPRNQLSDALCKWETKTSVTSFHCGIRHLNVDAGPTTNPPVHAIQFVIGEHTIMSINLPELVESFPLTYTGVDVGGPLALKRDC